MIDLSEKTQLDMQVSFLCSEVLWKIMTSEKDPREKLKEVLEVVAEFLNIEKVSLMLRNKQGEFSIFAAKGLARGIVRETSVKEGEGIAGMSIQEKKAIFMKKIGVSEGKDERKYSTDSSISYPIELDGKIVAVLNLTDRRDDISLTEKDMESIKPIMDRIKFVLKEMVNSHQKL